MSFRKLYRGLFVERGGRGLLPSLVVLSLAPLFFLNCQKTEKKSELSGLVESLRGRVTADSAALKKGDMVQENALLEAGSNSLCDLLVRSGVRQFTVRLLPNSALRFIPGMAGGKADIEVRLARGRGFFKVPPGGSGSLRVRTPTAIASVRGTQFAVDVPEGGYAELTVFQGKVAYRPRIKELDDLPPEIVEKSPELKEVMASLDSSASVVKEQESLTLEKSDAEKQVAEIPELKTLLEKPELKKIVGKKEITPAERDAALGAIQRELKTPEKRERLKKSIEAAVEKQKKNPRRLPEKEMREKLQDLQEGTTAGEKGEDKATAKRTPTKKRSFTEKVKEYQKLVKKNKKINRNTFKAKVTRIFNKQPEEIRLNNGQVLYGVVFQRGTKYHIYTEKGRRIVNENELAEIKF